MSPQIASQWAVRLRRMGWFTLVFFTVKGVVSSALLAWALWRALA